MSKNICIKLCRLVVCVCVYGNETFACILRTHATSSARTLSTDNGTARACGVVSVSFGPQKRTLINLCCRYGHVVEVWINILYDMAVFWGTTLSANSSPHVQRAYRLVFGRITLIHCEINSTLPGAELMNVIVQCQQFIRCVWHILYIQA